MNLNSRFAATCACMLTAYNTVGDIPNMTVMPWWVGYIAAASWIVAGLQIAIRGVK